MSEWAPAAAGGRSASARGSVASATSSSPWDLADADAGAESDDWVRQKHVREAATAPPRHQSSLQHSRGRHQIAGRAHGPDLTAAGWRGGGASDSQPWSGGTRSHAESERHSGAPTDEASGDWQQVPARRNSTRHRHDGHRRRPTTWTPSEAFLNAAAFGNTERVKYFMSKAGGSIDPSTRDAGGTPGVCSHPTICANENRSGRCQRRRTPCCTLITDSPACAIFTVTRVTHARQRSTTPWTTVTKTPRVRSSLEAPIQTSPTSAKVVAGVRRSTR